MNGFSIVQMSNSFDAPNERRFSVKDPDGSQWDTVVEVDVELVAHVQRITWRALPLTSSFWTSQAERFLADFLWNDGKTPSSGRLTLKGLNREELTRARLERRLTRFSDACSRLCKKLVDGFCEAGKSDPSGGWRSNHLSLARVIVPTLLSVVSVAVHAIVAVRLKQSISV